MWDPVTWIVRDGDIHTPKTHQVRHKSCSPLPSFLFLPLTLQKFQLGYFFCLTCTHFPHLFSSFVFLQLLVDTSGKSLSYSFLSILSFISFIYLHFFINIYERIPNHLRSSKCILESDKMKAMYPKIKFGTTKTTYRL